MVGTIFKIILALLAGCFSGLAIGIPLGFVFGFGLLFVFREIVAADLTTLMCVLMAIILGGLLAAATTAILNKIFETNDPPLLWASIGAGIGFTVVLFYGVIAVPAPELLKVSFYNAPMYYGATLGGQIGSIVCPLLALLAILRDKMRAARELRENQKREEERKYGISVY